MALLGTRQAAERLKVTPRRIAAMIVQGKLPAEKVGGSWVIRESDLEKVRNRRVGYPKGRPRKPRRCAPHER